MLTERESLIALVANAIAVYSILSERGELPGDATTMYGFVLEAIPARCRSAVTAELIDDVFESVTAAHNNS